MSTDREIVKEYSSRELTIVWKPRTCIHAAECVKNLPRVFNPREKPWIKMGNAESEKIIVVVRKCPSGAISIK